MKKTFVIGMILLAATSAFAGTGEIGSVGSGSFARYVLPEAAPAETCYVGSIPEATESDCFEVDQMWDLIGVRKDVHIRYSQADLDRGNGFALKQKAEVGADIRQVLGCSQDSCMITEKKLKEAALKHHVDISDMIHARLKSKDNVEYETYYKQGQTLQTSSDVIFRRQYEEIRRAEACDRAVAEFNQRAEQIRSRIPQCK